MYKNSLRFLIASALFFLSVVYADQIKTNKTPIEHVVFLMLENRSFDHMLGYLKNLNSDIEGCVKGLPGCSNPVDPTDPNSEIVDVDDTAVYVQVSPDHSIHGTTSQIYGVNSDAGEAKMNGFISSYTSTTKTTADGKTIMKNFSPDHVPVIANITMEFAHIDGWYSGVPGPTMPNRAFAASATSHGMGVNDVETIVKGMPQGTFFGQLRDMGLDYRVYFELIPTVLQFKEMRRKDARERYFGMKQFFQDVSDNNLPEVTWLEPRYYSTPNYGADDQHPDHDVGLGEELISKVYETLRASDLWEKSALIITYDEHGGFFDHVAPPTGVPSPDGLVSEDENFDFTRLGVRVPFVVASPWVKKGHVIHAPPKGEPQFEHSSIPATLIHKLFAPKPAHKQPGYLTNRDAAAATFEGIFTNTLRTDCPLKTSERVLHKDIFEKKFGLGSFPVIDGSLPLNDLQTELLGLARGICGDNQLPMSEMKKMKEAEAASYIAECMNKFFEREVISKDDL